MQLHQVRYFLAVADTLNFTSAAAACCVSQPALSRALQQLEHELGGNLIYRQRAKTCLTPLGKMMEPIARRMLAAHAEMRSAAQSFRAGDRDRLRLGVAGACSMSRVLELVAVARGRVPSVQLEISQGAYHDLLSRLSVGELDGVCAAYDSRTLDDGVRAERLYDDELVIALPAHKATVQTFELNKMTLFEVQELDLNIELKREGPALGRSRVKCSRIEMAVHAVKHGMGFTIVPESILEGTGLISRRFGSAVHQQFGLLTIRGRRFCNALSEFVRASSTLSRRKAESALLGSATGSGTGAPPKSRPAASARRQLSDRSSAQAARAGRIDATPV